MSLNNRKDPTLRRMIKVVSKATSGTDLLSFLKDRNWGTPGDRRRNPRWDLLRSYQHEAHTRGVERLEIADQNLQNQGGGQDPLVREESEHGTDEARARLRMPVDDTFMEGMETRMTGEGEDTTGTETTKITPPRRSSTGDQNTPRLSHF